MEAGREKYLKSYIITMLMHCFINRDYRVLVLKLRDLHYQNIKFVSHSYKDSVILEKTKCLVRLVVAMFLHTQWLSKLNHEVTKIRTTC